MEWLVFVVFAHLSWAFAVLITRTILTKHIRSIFVFGAFAAFVGLLPLFLIPFKGLIIPQPSQLLLSLFTGMLYLYGMLPYYKALTIEEVSRVIPLWRFIPLFVLLFAVLFVGERLDFDEFVAFILLLLGGYVISVRNFADPLKISRAFYLMLFSSFLFGIYHTLTKYIYMNQSFYNGFIIIRFGTFLGALSMLCFTTFRNQIITVLPRVKIQVTGMLLMHGILVVAGLALLNYAISIGPVSVISAASGVQAVFIFILATLLSRRHPHILAEEINTKIFVQKCVGILFISVGGGIIALK